MRSIYGPGRLLLASKKPQIKKLIKDIKNLTVDQIKQLKEKPDVIKGLIEIKELGTDKGTNAELIATAMQKNHNTTIEIPCTIYQYNGEPFWVKTSSSELRIENTWHWMELAENKINISSNTIRLSTADFTRLKTSSNFIKIGLLKDLRLLEKDRISKLL